MARFNTTLAALAATGLVVAQPAAAAVRTGATIDDSEAAVPPGSGMVVGLIGLLALVFGIMAITDDGNDNNDLPDSP